MTALEIREITPGEIIVAAAVLGRGMRDNPIHVRALGPVPDRRERALTRIFEVLLSQYLHKGIILGAFDAGILIGVCAMVRPGRCRPALRERLGMLRVLFGIGSPGSLLNLLRWASRWAGHDPQAVHWHLGPVGVERHLQGRGVGSALLAEFSVRMDAVGGLAYLETDKADNVRFYQRFGFRTAAEDTVLDVPSWFMVRDAQGERS